jgi:hypothetical protein
MTDPDRLRFSEENTLRVTAPDTLRADVTNAIMVSEEVMRECVHLSEQYDLDRELERLRRKAEGIRKQQDDRKRATAVAARVWSDQRRPNLRLPTGYSPSQADLMRCRLGSVYAIAWQTNQLQMSFPGYSTNALQRSCLGMFPGAGLPS